MGKNINDQITDCKKRIEAFKEIGKPYLIITQQKLLKKLMAEKGTEKKKGEVVSPEPEK